MVVSLVMFRLKMTLPKGSNAFTLNPGGVAQGRRRKIIRWLNPVQFSPTHPSRTLHVSAVRLWDSCSKAEHVELVKGLPVGPMVGMVVVGAVDGRHLVLSSITW